MLLYGRVHRSGELLQAFCAEAGVQSKGKRAAAWSSMLLENMLCELCVGRSSLRIVVVVKRKS